MKNGVHYVRKTLNTIPGNLYERPRLTYYKTKKPLRNIDINLSNSSSDENKPFLYIILIQSFANEFTPILSDIMKFFSFKLVSSSGKSDNLFK